MAASPPLKGGRERTLDQSVFMSWVIWFHVTCILWPEMPLICMARSQSLTFLFGCLLHAAEDKQWGLLHGFPCCQSGDDVSSLYQHGAQWGLWLNWRPQAVAMHCTDERLNSECAEYSVFAHHWRIKQHTLKNSLSIFFFSSLFLFLLTSFALRHNDFAQVRASYVELKKPLLMLKSCWHFIFE